MGDILGQAIWDYYHKNKPAKLWIHNTYGPKEEMPVRVYFRNGGDMPPLELMALAQCNGTVLDVGAGAGSHALFLQAQGLDVTAMDISAKAAQVMAARGVAKVVQADIFLYNEKKYDTLLLLMNGIGLAGSITKLRIFLRHAKNLLLPGGQLVFDSSDIAYLYEGNLPDNGIYYGELAYEYAYKGQKSGWFNWLYIDKATLIKTAAVEGWETEILFDDGADQYLAKLTQYKG
jgi:SAM-dependent methyltransferase